MPYCEGCGSGISGDAAFCSKCGRAAVVRPGSASASNRSLPAVPAVTPEAKPASWARDIWSGLLIGIYVFGCLSLCVYLGVWVSLNGNLYGYLPVGPLFFLWTGIISAMMPGTAAKVRRWFLGVPPGER